MSSSFTINPCKDSVSYQVDEMQTLLPEANPWEVSYSDGDTTATLITSSEVYQYFMSRYPDYMCSNMWHKFSAYNLVHAFDLRRAQYAFYADYDPLDNYNGETEHIHTKDNGDETRTHKTGGDGGTHNTVTTAALDNTYTQHDVTTYDNSTPRMDSKDTQSGGNIVTDNLHTEDKTTHGTTSKTIGETTYTGDEVYHEIEKKHGNLGVTTSQQMIDAEVQMRLRPINQLYLDNFISEYAYYIGGAWECEEI